MDKLLLMFKALSDRNRLRVVAALSVYDELCACHIVELLQVSGATVSTHMSLLIQAGIVKSRKEGRWTHYKLADPEGDIGAILNAVTVQLNMSDSVKADQLRLESIVCCTESV